MSDWSRLQIDSVRSSDDGSPTPIEPVRFNLVGAVGERFKFAVEERTVHLKLPSDRLLRRSKSEMLARWQIAMRRSAAICSS